MASATRSSSCSPIRSGALARPDTRAAHRRTHDSPRRPRPGPGVPDDLRPHTATRTLSGGGYRIQVPHDGVRTSSFSRPVLYGQAGRSGLGGLLVLLSRYAFVAVPSVAVRSEVDDPDSSYTEGTSA